MHQDWETAVQRALLFPHFHLDSFLSKCFVMGKKICIENTCNKSHLKIFLCLSIKEYNRSFVINNTMILYIKEPISEKIKKFTALQ